MRIIIVSLAAILATACTKRNPQACCTDAADCMNVGLPVGTTCDEGELCRGNRCLEKTCEMTSDCDGTAPYCVTAGDGHCSETCTTDAQCPGVAQTADQSFCVAGQCAQCRAGMNDCPMDAPICSEGRCVACSAHTDCATGVCGNGSCATEDQVAYVATNGSPSSDCTQTSPCSTLSRALIVNPPRPYVLIDAGTYSSTTAISVGGTRALIGRGATRPVLTRSTQGPIISTVNASVVRFEHLEIFGATGTTDPNEGHGVKCANGGAPTVELVDMLFRMNLTGIRGQSCNLKVIDSTFTNNTEAAISVADGGALVDRTTLLENGRGLSFDGGIYVVTNSVIARNNQYGIDIYSADNGNRFEFNTIIDNGNPTSVYGGFSCNLQGTAVGTFPNNIIARNKPFQTTGSQCTYPSSIVVDADISPLKLKRADSAPFDYHIQAGSIAIDAATISTVKADFDGEARPFGAAGDVGADELH